MAESTSALPALLVVILVIAGFVLIILLMVRGEKNRWSARKRELSNLGFTEVALPSQHMAERLERLYRRSPKQKFDLRHLFEKPAYRGTFYYFELVETSGDDNTWLGANAVAVFSPDLRLPRAHIAGRMSFKGKAGSMVGGWMVSMAEKVVGWAGRQGGYTRMNVGDHPSVDEKLIVMVEDEAAASAILTAERLERLTWLAEYEKWSGLQCDGDIFILERQTTPRRPNFENDVKALVEDATSAWLILSGQ
jgi:hypothetical protein